MRENLAVQEASLTLMALKDWPCTLLFSIQNTLQQKTMNTEIQTKYLIKKTIEILEIKIFLSFMSFDKII